jgi:hypothetical protein
LSNLLSFYIRIVSQSVLLTIVIIVIHMMSLSCIIEVLPELPGVSRTGNGTSSPFILDQEDEP